MKRGMEILNRSAFIGFLRGGFSDMGTNLFGKITICLCPNPDRLSSNASLRGIAEKRGASAHFLILSVILEGYIYSAVFYPAADAVAVSSYLNGPDENRRRLSVTEVLPSIAAAASYSGRGGI